MISRLKNSSLLILVTLSLTPIQNAVGAFNLRPASDVATVSANSVTMCKTATSVDSVPLTGAMEVTAKTLEVHLGGSCSRQSSGSFVCGDVARVIATCNPSQTGFLWQNAALCASTCGNGHCLFPKENLEYVPFLLNDPTTIEACGSELAKNPHHAATMKIIKKDAIYKRADKTWIPIEDCQIRGEICQRVKSGMCFISKCTSNINSKRRSLDPRRLLNFSNSTLVQKRSLNNNFDQPAPGFGINKVSEYILEIHEGFTESFFRVTEPNYGDYWFIGFGHPCGTSKSSDDCKDISPPITIEEAQIMLQTDLIPYYRCICRKFKGSKQLNENQFGALVDYFYYNIDPNCILVDYDRVINDIAQGTGNLSSVDFTTSLVIFDDYSYGRMYDDTWLWNYVDNSPDTVSDLCEYYQSN